MTEIKPLPNELQNVAIEELGEMPARVADGLQALKRWIQQQPYLKARNEDQFLIQFLRGCKYRLEKAKEKIYNFYDMKSKYPDLFHITDVDEIRFRQHHNTGSYIPLPIPLNGCGPRIIVTRFNFTPKEYTSQEISQYIAAISEVMLLNDPYACIHGMVYVSDFAKVKIRHSLLLPPGILKKIATFYEKTFPVRIKAIYLINMPTYVERLFNIIRPCFPEKLRQRIFVFGKHLEKLSNQVPRKYLPIEYGGENGSLDHLCAEYNKVWDEYREHFKQNSNYGLVMS